MKLIKWGIPIVVRADWLIKIAEFFNGTKMIDAVEWIPFVTVVEIDNPSERLLRHEKIHHLQQCETLFIFYYLFYVAEYLVLRLCGYNHYSAYKNIMFEKEAYKYQSDKNYIKTRKLWAWWKI